MRLNRYLAQSGLGSRRAVEGLIRTGVVSVNGKVVQDLATQIDEQRDRVTVDGQAVHPAAEFVYIILNKPRGYDVTRGDRHSHRRAYDLLPKNTHASVQAVGRLDRNSTGLLLFTNDGDLAFRLAHPRYGCQKIYEVELAGTFDAALLRRLTEGIELEDGPAHAVQADVLPERTTESFSLRLVMEEGRKHIVRRLCEALGYPVLRLNRVAMGPLSLGALRTGKTRNLLEREVRALYRCAGMTGK